MNEKKKKTLKKVGIIAGCFVGGAGLMWAGYLIGSYMPMNGYEMWIVKSKAPGKAIDILNHTPLMLKRWASTITLSPEEATKLVKTTNEILQEVV